MRHLGLGLIAEGSSDHAFFGALLRRVVEDICVRDAIHQIEVPAVMSLSVTCSDRAGYFQTAADVARQAAESCNLIFLHRDSGGRAQQTDTSFIDRLFREVQEAVHPAKPVRVVPVQEMEAWALADGDALRFAFKTTLPDSDLGLPAHPAQVEHITDPKAALERAYRKTLPPRRRKREVSLFLEVIALSLRINRLREIPAFQAFEHELLEALVSMRYLRLKR